MSTEYLELAAWCDEEAKLRDGAYGPNHGADRLRRIAQLLRDAHADAVDRQGGKA